jgi:ABC-type nitrate/sulfonate/bicarbonate transport system substrate-binding protein
MNKVGEEKSKQNRPLVGGFTREDFDRLNRVAHARNLRAVIESTKWLNYHGEEVLRRYPDEFRRGAGMTVSEYLQALAVHAERCRALIDQMNDSASEQSHHAIKL